MSVCACVCGAGCVPGVGGLLVSVLGPCNGNGGMDQGANGGLSWSGPRAATQHLVGMIRPFFSSPGRFWWSFFFVFILPA